MTEAFGELGIAQRRHGFGDMIGQSEQRSSNRLEDPEPSLYCALTLWIAFALRCVLGTQLIECITRCLGHVRGTLIGDRLEALATGDGGGEHVGHVLGALVVINHNGAEQVLITSADVLRRDQLEGHSENRQVRGISPDLGTRDDQVEAEAWTPQSWRARFT